MIGIFDSGLGGLSVLRSVHELLPQHELCYLADSAYCPYGVRSTAEVRVRSALCCQWLVAQGAQLVVVACNTATAAALEMLRATLPVPVVGMEPGIKPAIAATRNGVIGVLATGGTLASRRFASLVQRFANNVQVHTVPCPGLVECVEAGDLAGTRPRALVARYLAALRAADTLVLGCTHYPFLAALIAETAGPAVTLIDTGPAVARHVAILAGEVHIAVGRDSVRICTTGSAESCAAALPALLPQLALVPEQVQI